MERHTKRSKRPTDKELIAEAQSLHNDIFVVDCYSTGDMIRYDQVLAALEKRGYEANETRSLSFTKG